MKEARIVILKSSWKIFKLYLICSVIYLALTIPDWTATGWFSFKAFIDWGISFFTYGSYFHLWYLIEVCYALLILALILPLIRKPFVYLFIIILWVIEVLQYAYAMILPSAVQNIFRLCERVPLPFESVVRVLPLLLLGIVICHSKQRKTAFYVVGLMVSEGLLFAEVFFVKSLGGEKYGYVVSTLLIAFFLFETVHSFDSVIRNTNTIEYAKISTIVYLAHPAYILILKWIVELPHYAVFLIVTVLSVLTGAIYYQIVRLIKSRSTVQKDYGRKTLDE